MAERETWHVLIIERSPDDALLLQQVFESLGSHQFLVTIAVSVPEARAVLDRTAFDIVIVAHELVDFADPVGIRRLRRAGSERALVAVTHPEASDDDVARIVLGGADAVLRKDERNPMEIIHVVRELIARRSQTRDRTTP